jgi:hypothetical protein
MNRHNGPSILDPTDSKIKYSHPEPPPSWLQSLVAEQDRLKSLPRKQVVWLQRLQLIGMIGFALGWGVAFVSIFAGIGYLIAVSCCLAVLFLLSHQVALWFFRCPGCGARLKAHGHGNFCYERTPGKMEERTMFDCRACRTMWDVGRGVGSTPGN